MFRIGIAFLLLAATHAVGGGLTLKVQDVICVPGKDAILTAEVARPITLSLKSGKPRVEVEFFIDGRSLGRATANAEGIAVLKVNPGRVQSRSYTARAYRKGRTFTAQGRWFNWQPDRTIIAVDIDDTVCWTRYSDLFISDRDHFSRPLEGSAETLNQLSRRFYILYISARPFWLTDKTREWLNDNGFPAGPVVHRGGWESCLRQRAVKEEILADLRSYLPNLLIGIGDRDLDMLAFGSHGMVTLLVRNPQLAVSKSRAIGFDGWRRLGKYCAKHEAGFSDAVALARAIALNELPPTVPVNAGLSEASESRRSPPTVSATVFR